MNLKITYVCISLFLIILAGCSENYTPKPRGYFRIDLEEKNYINYESKCGFNFDVPGYSKIELFQGDSIDSCWMNISYPEHDAKLHLTYLTIEDDIEYYLEDAYQFAFKHESKANAINSTVLSYPDHQVGSLLYDLKGNVATSLQFFATDSVDHFLRGSLYFNNRPNEDSISPVLEYLREDVIRLIETLEWK